MQFIDLAAQYRALEPKIRAAMDGVLQDGRFIHGPVVKELEQQLADYVGRRFCVACGNGTDGLILPLLAMEVGPGDAVFVPDFTFFATAEAVAAVGATPVFTDVDPVTFNMDVASLKAAIAAVKAEGKLTPKGIIPVDLFGLPADYQQLEAVAKEEELWILEDAAQGFGGTQNGFAAGAFGQVASTSFFPAKPLGCYGDGGAMFTDDEELRDRLISLRVHGSDPADKYNNLRIGRNSRLDSLQAAILQVKLEAFPEELHARHRAAAWYDQRLKDTGFTPVIPAGFTSSYAQYTLRLPDLATRTRVASLLKVRGIPTMIYYPRPLHGQTAFADAKLYVPCPVAEALSQTVLSLPMHPYLEESTVDTVCTALRASL